MKAFSCIWVHSSDPPIYTLSSDVPTKAHFQITSTPSEIVTPVNVLTQTKEYSGITSTVEGIVISVILVFIKAYSPSSVTHSHNVTDFTVPKPSDCLCVAWNAFLPIIVPYSSDHSITTVSTVDPTNWWSHTFVTQVQNVTFFNEVVHCNARSSTAVPQFFEPSLSQLLFHVAHSILILVTFESWNAHAQI